MSLSFCFKIYIDWGDKWLRSFDETVVWLVCRPNWFFGGIKFPLCIAFLTASVNDENDATVWIGLFKVFETSESVDNFVVGLYKADDDEVFGCSVKCFILENNVQRVGISVDEFDAK